MNDLRQREPRLHDPEFLRWLKTKPCCVCGRSPVDAAHVKFGSKFYGKRSVGMSEKPDDRWAVPLCRECHTSQHNAVRSKEEKAEQNWWRQRRILPLALAMKLYSEFGGTGGQVRHKRRPRVTIVPKGFAKRKIVSRPFPRAKRKIMNRRFK